MARLRYLFHVLVYSNVIIALAAVAQCALTYHILYIPSQPFVLIIDGCSTFLLYNFSLFLSKPQFPDRSPYERVRWFFVHRRFMYGMSAVAMVLLGYALFHIHFYTLVYLVFIGLLSLSYHVPLLQRNKTRGGLRQVPGLKLLYIAVIWSLSTVGLPMFETWAGDVSISWYEVIYLGGIKVLFITLCTLPFDIRDIKQDAHYGLRTLPVMFGEARAIQFNYVLLALHSVLVWLAPYAIDVKMGLILTNVLIAVLLYTVIFNSKQQHYNNVYLLDVMLTVQYIVVLATAHWI